MGKREPEVVQGGAIIVRSDARTPRVLVIRSSDGDSWLFPKGRVEEGESSADAAAREAIEEAGVVAEAGRFVGRDSYQRGKRRVEVRYYRMVYAGDAPADEDRDMRWCTASEAKRLLSFPELHRILDLALCQSRVVRDMPGRREPAYPPPKGRYGGRVGSLGRR
jgi:8-oxo-(d)GTP phosphatase